MLIRNNIYEFADGWSEPILWYARAVKSMKSRPLDNVTSWQFYGAIHGYLRWLWDLHGITQPTDPEPADDLANPKYINQCQHQTWYFLPWHRGYLLAFEKQIRHEIELLGGPHETWALPYWNYFETERQLIPPAFRTQSWPDGLADNPLFVEQRWGPLSNDPTFDIDTGVDLKALSEPQFEGTATGGSAGFGGIKTGFVWSGNVNGMMESQPHNPIHGLIGGDHPTAKLPFPPPDDDIPVPGLMSTPQTAALDPIFWLHHCNIDRLWESWNKFPPNKPRINPDDWNNPSDQDWLDGPAASGDRPFVMPNPDGSDWNFTPGQMRDIAALGYSYFELTPGQPIQTNIVAARATNLGLAQPVAFSGGVAMASQKSVELLGSGSGKVTLSGAKSSRHDVNLDATAVARLSTSLSGAVVPAQQPDRVFLNLENVRSKTDSILLQVYVGLKNDANPADSPDNLAGTISLFGSALASDPSEQHAGDGITHVIEITEIVDRLYLNDELSANLLSVVIVPANHISSGLGVEIGNISLYRQSE